MLSTHARSIDVGERRGWASLQREWRKFGGCGPIDAGRAERAMMRAFI